MELADLRKSFDSRFGTGVAPQAVRAPGRVNLIGEHTDYNDGFVLPIAIDKQIVALVRPRTDRQVRLASAELDGQAVLDLDKPIARGEPKWSNYCRGVLAGLKVRPDGGKLIGADVLFSSNIPLGGGLSSSAALEVATALVMQIAGGTMGKIPSTELALLCQKAEHEFAGTPCGIMDQSIVILGQPGHALLLDCRDHSTRQVPFNDPKLVLLVADTQVKHELNDGGYSARRAQCESAARKLGVRALRDASAAQVNSAKNLTEVERKRARHVVGEIARTLQAVKVLEAGDYSAFGQLMYGSHEALRDDYEVSCAELDRIVELARGQQGVFGARMTGGGFGGCAIILVAADKAQAVSAAVAEGYKASYGRPCPIFATHAAAGASAL